jgi:hypothetical protein
MRALSVVAVLIALATALVAAPAQKAEPQTTDRVDYRHALETIGKRLEQQRNLERMLGAGDAAEKSDGVEREHIGSLGPKLEIQRTVLRKLYAETFEQAIREQAGLPAVSRQAHCCCCRD